MQPCIPLKPKSAISVQTLAILEYQDIQKVVLPSMPHAAFL